jgi:molybdopterin-guanine dinucleotide biosynthesis protein A
LTLSNATHQGTAGFVLAGGESRRMGRDKAMVEFAGEPLVVRGIKILREAGLEPGIAGARANLEQYAPVIADIDPGRGPLGGICAALAACREQRAVFLPVDLPLLPALLITVMVRRAQLTSAVLTVPSLSGFSQTFPVVIDRAALPALKNALEQERGACFAAFQAAAAAAGQSIAAIPVEYLAQAGQVTHTDGLSPAMWFLNVNSPAELRRAEALVGRVG